MKHLLLEIEVADAGQEQPWFVTMLIEDALYGHMEKCVNKEGEKPLFGTLTPRVRVLTEEVPV